MQVCSFLFGAEIKSLKTGWNGCETGSLYSILIYNQYAEVIDCVWISEHTLASLPKKGTTLLYESDYSLVLMMQSDLSLVLNIYQNTENLIIYWYM